MASNELEFINRCKLDKQILLVFLAGLSSYFNSLYHMIAMLQIPVNRIL